MSTDAYTVAVDHGERLMEALTRPQPDWREIKAHAQALAELARAELDAMGSA